MGASPTTKRHRRVPRYLDLEGCRVSIALADGSRIDDCELVSAGRGRPGTLWLFTEGRDVFLALGDVVDLWPAEPITKHHAA